MIILPNQIKEALNKLEDAGFEAYIVGSCVRELVLGHSPADYDIVTNAEINDILFTFRDYRISDEGMNRGEILVTILGMVIQISPYRREVVGNRVMYAQDLETDLARRGFSMNAMAYSEKSGLIDPYDGKSALTGEIRQIVAIGENVSVNIRNGGKISAETVYDMTKSFTSNPVRLLEAIRYCSEDEYEIEERTRSCMKANVSCFEYADADSIRKELQRIVMGKFAARALEQNEDILKYVLPEIEPCVGLEQCSKHHDFSVWTHICKSVGYAVPEPAIRFAMLFHDFGKPDCMYIDSKGSGHFKGHGERGRLLADGIMRRLNFPKDMAEEISWLVYHHDVKIPTERKELKRLIRELGAEDLRKLIQCEIADNRAKKIETETERVSELRESLAALNEIMDTGECYQRSQLAVTKRELTERRLVSNDDEAEQLLDALFDIVLDKPSFNNRLMLLDIAEKSKSKLAEIEEQRRKSREEKENFAKDRRSEPIFSKHKKQ